MTHNNALAVAMKGVKTEGAMAPELRLDRQRPAEYVFDKNVTRRLSEIREAEAQERAKKASTAA